LPPNEGERVSVNLDSRPSAATYDVEALVNMAWDGKLRIPHFQRDFRWNWDDVRKLMDSIIKGYPIGSLLLWTRPAPAQMLHLGELNIKAPAQTDALWVVDGQQRLTSLANVLSPSGQSSPRFAMAYSLELGDFVHTPQIEDPLVIPLPVIFDLQQILKWFNRYPHIADYIDDATSLTRKIRQFEVPAYLVSQNDPTILQDIFDRMNSYGKRLSRAEIFSALNAGDENSKDNSLSFASIADRIDQDLQFGKLDNDTVLAAVLARRGAEVRRDIRTEFTAPNDEGREAAYRAGEEALRGAVSFLQEEVGVPHLAMLAYRYLLVVLARLFAFYPHPDSRNLRLLRRWYWQAAVAGPEQFRGGTPNAARVLCTQVVQGDLNGSVQGLLSAVHRSTEPTLDLSRFATNEASTKILLCGWWDLGPRNPSTGQPYDRSDLAESLAEQNTARDAVRYLLPSRAAPPEKRKWAANRALMPGLEVDPREVVTLMSRPPLDMDEDIWLAMLRSHSVTAALSDLLFREKYPEFIFARQQILKEHAHDFLARVCEWGFEDTPPLDSLIVDEDYDDVDD
jgi:Protein of unknown function DUF262